MPKLVTETIPHHQDWKRHPLKAIAGSIVVCVSLFYLLSLLPSIARTDTIFVISNLAVLSAWFLISHNFLQRLGWQSAWLALFTMIIGVGALSYLIVEDGQTLVTYSVGAVLGMGILIFYYYKPRKLIWIILPFLLLFIVGFQINQRLLENSTIQSLAAQDMETSFTAPLYFPTSTPTQKFFVKHFYWDSPRQKLRFVTKGGLTINETVIMKQELAPPQRCGNTSCKVIGEIQKGQQLYSAENAQFIEYFARFDKTLIRITSTRNHAITTEEALAYMREFKKTTSIVLFKQFDYKYLLADSYYFVPKQIYHKDSASFSVAGETNF